MRTVRAVVFDTDGVITDSARLHAAAWKQAFDHFLREQADRADHPAAHPGRGGADHPARREPAQDGRDAFRPFDVRADYLRYVDGKSRLDGAADFLASRGLHLPPETVAAVAGAKDRLFTAALAEGGSRAVPAYPGTVRLLRALHRAGVPCAAVSASRHARDLLCRADVLDLLVTVVDGNEAARLGLPGKPDPALFEEAARRLGSPARETAVVEDALAGVEAGRRGGFGLVVGVYRADRDPAHPADPADPPAGPAGDPDTGGGAAALHEHGADLVVTDLAELLDETAGAAHAKNAHAEEADRHRNRNAHTEDEGGPA
ncbi:HAD-IA family hydrolase [Streptomyces sp. 549]|uniref:HAD family hydrolase n=1 Tax=Streptomyces sp. 549 TaxID=3049076 RepID=UPI0024C2AAC5|nr:HAD-IA family hydrolase [Streptomyces sp. 549]MDK1472233.1 HAD-IA family hydrolase [Streptomyces sp. 549]